MAGIIGNGLTALLASQRALQTVGNNISNASTEGYVRQRVNLVEAPSQSFGAVSFGQGVRVGGVERLYDQLLTEQFQEAGSLTARADAFNTIAARTDRLLGNSETGIAASIQRFFDQMEAVSREPTSMANRQQLLLEGQALASRFADLEGELGVIGTELEARLRQSVDAVNQLSAQIARLNERIVASGVNPPPDLLDQRDLLLRQLGEQIDVRTTTLPDGSLSVFAGSGQSLVIGTNVNRLEVIPDALDASRLEVAVRTGSADAQEISGRIAGGVIGGLLAARTDVVEPARLQLAQLAVGLASAFNAQHRAGVDYDGALGGDFFHIEGPVVLTAPSNTGTAAVTATLEDASSLEARDYELRYTGSSWLLLDRANGSPVAMTGTGTVADPFRADGMAFSVSGTPDAGDQFLLRPARDAAGRLSLAITDPVAVAAAGPLTTSADIGNLSDATIGAATVSDLSDPDLLTGALITFTSATDYTVTIGATTSGPFTYSSGADISFAGWTVQLTGAPVTGDRFRVSAARAGTGDNANALALAGIPQRGWFDNGRQSFSDLNADLVSTVGAVASRARSDLTAQQTILGQAELDLEAVSGVNLDEEAAELLKYQQSYQAAAKLIGVGDELFRTILSILAR